MKKQQLVLRLMARIDEEAILAKEQAKKEAAYIKKKDKNRAWAANLTKRKYLIGVTKKRALLEEVLTSDKEEYSWESFCADNHIRTRFL